jgi:lysyl-tRNA synthetase class 1
MEGRKVGKQKTEWVYWTDKVAEDVRRRVAESDKLKRIVKERSHIVYDEKTPSGPIHVGAARGWLIHDIIAKTMRMRGMKARFILSSDDIDPMDGLPKSLDPAKWKKFMGVPLRNIPSPEPGYESYADFFFTECTNRFEEFGIEAELESTGQRYIDGDFNPAIKTLLDNAEKIQKIYERLYGKTIASEKLPFQPICEKCGKIGTTFVYEWDSDREVVKYECRVNMVEWAEGCGYKGEVSPYNGNGKLPWKIEWAAKWPTVGVVAELAGKDHFTRGGSRSVAVAIAVEVLDYPPPWPSSPKRVGKDYDIGKGYEFFLVGGRKMSSSKGIGASFVAVGDMLPAEMLRFLMIKSRPETTIEFTPQGNTIPFLFRDFDRIEKIYFGEEETSDRERNNAKRIYELTVRKIPAKKPYRIPFDFAAMLVQALPKENMTNSVAELLKRTGHVKKMTKEERDILEDTLSYAEKWVGEFAPEEMRLKISDSVPAGVSKLSATQKGALAELGDFLKQKRTDDELWDKIKSVAETAGIQPKEMFQAAYVALIGREYGPRLVPLIQSLDRDFVAKRFQMIG